MPIWNACQEHLAGILMSFVSRADTEAIRRALFAEYLDTIGKQTVGLIVSQMAAYGLGVDDLDALIEQVTIDVLAKLDAPSEADAPSLERRTDSVAANFGHCARSKRNMAPRRTCYK